MTEGGVRKFRRLFEPVEKMEKAMFLCPLAFGGTEKTRKTS